MILSLTYLVLIVGWTKAALFGEQCTVSSNCTDVNTYCYKYRDCGVGTCQCMSGYGNANGNACDSGLCDGTCQCQSGFTMAVHETYLACRAPQYGEYCTSSISCAASFDTTNISDDKSSHAPTCLLNVCLCPPSHELKVVMGYNLCLRKNDDYDLKENGETCTHFNECESSLCVKCVGSTTGVCMADDEATVTTPSFLLVAVPFILFTYFSHFPF